MAMQGNQTVYQRPEGESTQWEDIHQKLGNFPAKEPVQVSLYLQSPYSSIKEPPVPSRPIPSHPIPYHPVVRKERTPCDAALMQLHFTTPLQDDFHKPSMANDYWQLAWCDAVRNTVDLYKQDTWGIQSCCNRQLLEGGAESQGVCAGSGVRQGVRPD